MRSYMPVLLLLLFGCFVAFSMAKSSPVTSARRRMGIAPRIIGGTNATVGQFEFMAYFENPIGGNYYGICGGTLISAYYVLTAGHCCVPVDGFSEAAVRSGQNVHIGGWSVDAMLADSPPSTAGETHVIYSTSIPANFNATGNLENDICVVKMTTASSKPRIKLNFDSALDTSGPATIAGWGDISTANGGERPAVLQYVSVSIDPITICQSIFASTITNNQICAGSNTQGACSGDSGGPLFKQINGSYLELGTVSYGDQQCNTPGVFTRISQYQSFICSNSNNEPFACPGGTDDGTGNGSVNSAGSLLSHSLWSLL